MQNYKICSLFEMLLSFFMFLYAFSTQITETSSSVREQDLPSHLFGQPCFLTLSTDATYVYVGGNYLFPNRS